MFERVASERMRAISQEDLSPWQALDTATLAMRHVGRTVMQEATSPDQPLANRWVSHQISAAVLAFRRRDGATLRRLFRRIPERSLLFTTEKGAICETVDMESHASAFSVVAQRSILEDLKVDTGWTSDKNVARSLPARAAHVSWRLEACAVVASWRS